MDEMEILTKIEKLAVIIDILNRSNLFRTDDMLKFHTYRFEKLTKDYMNLCNYE